MKTSSFDIDAAKAHFKTRDPRMYELFREALEAKDPLVFPVAKPPREYFASIVSSIISQQISTKAADAVRGRVLVTLGVITPENVLATHEDTLRACGLSGQKTKYIYHNASVWHDVPSKEFRSMSDEAIISELTKLYGIGRWTAEMFLMFSLARPDVFSFGDFGLMQALYGQYGYRPHYRRKIATTVESWAPHRTLASLTLWHVKDNGPVLL